jgi:dipeptidyl-peptidase 4
VDPEGAQLLVSAGGDLFLVNAKNGKFEQVTKTADDEADPQLSPDGKRISYRLGSDLYVLEVAGRKLTRLTHDGSDTLWNARLDWVYPEELDLGTAHWWAPDSRSIAYLQFDVSREPVVAHTDNSHRIPRFEPQRYPKAGDPNADVRVGVVPAEGGRTRWMDVGETRDMLLARVDWLPDSSAVALQRLTRVQDRLDLLVPMPPPAPHAFSCAKPVPIGSTSATNCASSRMAGSSCGPANAMGIATSTSIP